jgi:hypothetical protein
MAGHEHHAALRELRALQGERRKYGASARRPTPPEPAQNEATVPEVDGAGKEAQCPIDVSQQTLMAEIPSSYPRESP